jgi:mycothiol synthase
MLAIDGYRVHTELPALPTLHGLTVRLAKGKEDLHDIWQVLSDSNAVDKAQMLPTVEELEHLYYWFTNFDFCRDMILAYDGDRPAAYCGMTWSDEPSGERIYHWWLLVAPDWRGRRIESILLDYAEKHLRALAARNKTGHEKYFQSWILDTEIDKVEMVEVRGYQPFTYGAIMVRPLSEPIPEAVLPEGLEVRPVEESHLRPIFDADQEAFRDHFGFIEADDKDKAFQNVLDFPHMDTSLWKIAWDGDRIAGQVKPYINSEENERYNRKRGYTEEISTHRSWRKKGVATALINLSLKELKERGMEEAALGVHTENKNGAYRLYEKLGYRIVEMQIVYRRPFC